MLGKVVSAHQTDWPEHLPFVVNAYNTTMHSGTGYTPFFLMFGREQQVPLDVVMNNPKEKSAGVSEYAAIILERMRA